MQQSMVPVRPLGAAAESARPRLLAVVRVSRDGSGRSVRLVKLVRRVPRNVPLSVQSQPVADRAPVSNQAGSSQEGAQMKPDPLSCEPSEPPSPWDSPAGRPLNTLTAGRRRR